MTDAMRDLNAKVALIYAGHRPALARSFAEFVFKEGSGAVVPDTCHGKKVRFGGRTWQWVGRELYGQDFVDALKAIIEEKKGETGSNGSPAP